ncbi:hypothetical protein F0562_007777 [Nyssa sinensis]|uniref:RWP-RK domain-containing protein n=1 Tax=Nyssa sinensis TaxID=561372 RepID=A0A5J5A5F0_9ASTE|nr:hypothetical protein F0562_007777 [Nyssa sinensis]
MDRDSVSLVDDDGGEVFGSDSIIEYMATKLSSLAPRSVSSGEGKYLKPLWVFWRREDDEAHRSLNLSLSPTLVPGTDHANSVIKEKIKSALQLLTFRERRVLVQFWAPTKIGDHCVLTTSDQPFGLGLIDKGLCSYRMNSMGYKFFIDGENEEDLGPPGRVFLKQWPEWTPNVQDCSRNKYPQLNHAVRCNIRGSLALPVLEPSDGHCVGVLELTLTSEYLDYAYEVREVCRALKDVNLKSSTIFDHPNMQICNDGRQRALDEIFHVLEVVCEAHKLPLAQTWVLSGHCSVVAYGGDLRKSCGSFDVSCMGQLCMSTTGAPFYVGDACMWRFWKASTEHHLQKGQGVVGRALSSNSLCFCRDVAQFSQTEYPLVHFARMYGLTSCFAICLTSTYTGDENYIIEFFLPPSIIDIEEQKNLLDSLVLIMNRHFRSFELASGEKLGEVLSAEVIKSSTDEIDSIQISHITKSSSYPNSLRNRDMVQLDLSDQELMVVFDAENNERNVASAEQRDHAITDSEKWSNIASAEPRDSAITDLERSSNISSAEQRDSFITESEKSSNFASAEQRDSVITDLEKRSNVIAVEPSDCVITDSERERDNAIIAYSDKKDTKKKVGRKSKRTEISINFKDLQQLFGRGLDEAAKSLGVSRSTLKRICRDHGISSWPRHKKKKDNGSLPKQMHMNESVGGAEKAFCQTSAVTSILSAATSTLTDIVSSTPLPASLNQSTQQNEKLPFRRAPAAVFPPDSLVSAPPKTPPGGRLIEIAGNSDNLQHLCLSASEGQIPETSWTDPLCSDLPPKQAVANAADRMPHVKATQEVRNMTIKVCYSGHFLKFQFSVSFGMVELQEEVAKRLKLTIGTFNIKYEDEDKDWILIGCNEDLQNCMDISRSMGSSSTTIRLLVEPITN